MRRITTEMCQKMHFIFIQVNKNVQILYNDIYAIDELTNKMSK